jgi:hypothetical protein
MPQPGLDKYDWEFNGNNREFNGNARYALDLLDFEESKVRSWVTIDSTEIGDVRALKGGRETGWSVRRRWNGSEWLYDIKKAKISGTIDVANKLRQTTIHIYAEASYPWGWAPSIRYDAWFLFKVLGPGKIGFQCTYTHKWFPDYEIYVLVGGRVRVSDHFKTHDKGPGIINLTWSTRGNIPAKKGNQWIILDAKTSK